MQQTYKHTSDTKGREIKEQVTTMVHDPRAQTTNRLPFVKMIESEHIW